MTHSDYLAVFDWNSTLLNDVEAVCHGINECLNFFDIAPMSVQKIQEIFTFPLVHFYKKAGVDIDQYLKHAEEVERLFNDKYNAFKLDSPLMEGTIPLLQWLQSHNVTCKILSNYNQKELEKDVTRLGILEYFDTVSGNSDPLTIVSSMNKYERLRDFMNENYYAAHKIFIIGDSHEEPDLARKLNILGISIAGGLLSPERLEAYKKDYVIQSLSELSPILVKEWGLKDPL